MALKVPKALISTSINMLYHDISHQKKTMLGKLLDGRYKVVQVLSAGGLGETYIAEDTRRPGNPSCVVKRLKPTSSESSYLQIARRLFNSEAQILEKLGNHDQIPRLLAYFEENEEFFLVQELIAGHPLSEDIQTDQPWAENQVIFMLEDVLHILEFVHRFNAIHRDIKPDNLIKRDVDGKLVLIDFGAVKQIRTQIATSPNQMTATVAIGTPGFMPAEQAQGKPRFNSDIYALGMLAIQALTGIPPHQLSDDPDTGEVFWQNRAQISPQLAVILEQMVSYHWRDRYQSVPEVLSDIQELQNYLPTMEPSMSPAFASAMTQTLTSTINNSGDDPELTVSITSPVWLKKTLSVIRFIPFVGGAGLFFFKSATWMILLGVFLAAFGVGLFFLGSWYPKLARNYDSVFAVIFSLSGILLIFQEYRRYGSQEIPLAEFMLAGAGIFAFTESIRLRTMRIK